MELKDIFPYKETEELENALNMAQCDVSKATSLLRDGKASKTMNRLQDSPIFKGNPFLSPIREPTPENGNISFIFLPVNMIYPSNF